MPGLFARVSAASITWVFRFTVGGQRRRATLGDFPPISLAEARQRAKNLRDEVGHTGRDPREPEPTSPVGRSLQELASAYVDAREPNLAATTATEYRRMAKKNLAVEVFAGPADQLGRGDIRAALEAVAKESGPAIANRLYQLIRASCRWAVREERRGPGGKPEALLARNPCEGLQRPRREESRDRVLSDDEVRALWSSTDPRKPAGACVRILLLLGQRGTETLLMRWADVDLVAARWTIPGSFRKGGRTNVVPLPPQAVKILKQLKAVTGTQERVFAGASVHNWVRWWEPIHTATVAAGAAPFHRHDLRRTCATGCAAAGAEPHIVSRILGHKALAGTLAVTGIYDRFDRLPQVHAALTAWASRVSKIAKRR